jgi:hypothetical protein
MHNRRKSLFASFRSPSSSLSPEEDLGVETHTPTTPTTPDKPPKNGAEVVQRKLEKAGVKEKQTLLRESLNLSDPTLVYHTIHSGTTNFAIPEVAEVNMDTLNTPFRPMDEVRVKLLFVDIGETNELVHKLLHITNLLPKYGRIHTGIAIGSKIIEWNDSSLCIPRPTASSKAFLALDVGTLVKTELQAKLEELSKVVVDWNVNKTYSMLQNNCQRFVDDCFSALEIEPKFEGLLAEYITSVRKEGSCSTFFKLAPSTRQEMLSSHGQEFIDELGFKDSETILFETHKQVDDFCFKIMNKYDEDFSKPNSVRPEHLELAALLKAFDRGFWLRQRKGLEEGKCSEKGCPFGDPALSGTNWIEPKTKKNYPSSGKVVASGQTSGQDSSSGEKCILQ